MKKPHFFLVFCYILVFVDSFSQEIDSVLYLNGKGGGIEIPSSASISPQESISISVWLRPENPTSKNREEGILSKASASSVTDFSDLKNWEVYDATNESGANDVKGFVGGVFDGRYIYCSPWWKGETQSGQVLRYDTQQPYEKTESWTVYNAENEDGEIDIRGLEGAVFDGRYVYFVPLHRDGNYYSTVLRYDTQLDFSNEESWEVFNAESLDSDGTLKGFVGAVFDGQFIYFIPNPFAPHTKVLRLNTKDDFSSAQAWSIYDLNTLDSGQYAGKGFFGAVYDGTYIYFVPFHDSGTLLRLNTKADYFAADSWSSVSIGEVVEGNTNNFFAGAVFDGRYIYYSPLTGGKVVRFDTSGDFFDPASWTQFEILNLDGENKVQGGVGPTFDGRYVYFPPMYDTEGRNGRSGKFVIYDTYKDFKDLSSWNLINMADTDQDLRGFEGSVFDGQYVYFPPMNFENSHGKILRYNTLPDDNLSYSLHYTRSSSSFGSVPNKLSFKIGTEEGVRSIFISGDHVLSDGQWHHIAATYDGTSLKLYLDGVLNNVHTYSQRAGIIMNDAELYIGNRNDSGNHGFKGYLNDLSIWDIALTESEVKQIITSSEPNQSPNLKAFWSFNKGNDNKGNDLSMVQDLTVNNNHGIETRGVEFNLAINAGEDDTVCPGSGPVQFTGYYPEGGVWTGMGVNSKGVFKPPLNMAGSTQKLIYSLTRTYGTVNKTFTSFKKVNIKDLPEIIASQKFICENGGVTLSANKEFSEYSWSTGEKTIDHYVTSPGKFSVTVNDDVCQLTSDTITISFAPIPQIEREDFLNLSASIDGVIYEWSKDDVVLPNNTQTFMPFAAGNYKLRIIDSTGCLSKFSEPYYYPGLKQNVTIFPNFSSGLFRVAITGPETKVFIYVLSASGRKVYEHEGVLVGAGTIVAIDLTNQAAGLYLVNIKTSEADVTKRVIIKK